MRGYWMKKNNKTENWIPGCYGLKYPATLIAANGAVIRGIGEETEMLTGIRGPGRWQMGKPMICFGGFVDPTDTSARDSLIRELSEEIPGLTLEVGELPFLENGPVRYEHYWDPVKRRAIKTNILAQEIPIITWYYLVRWIKGELQSSAEAKKLKWQPLEKILRTKKYYEFDSARILEKLSFII